MLAIILFALQYVQSHAATYAFPVRVGSLKKAEIWFYAAETLEKYLRECEKRETTYGAFVIKDQKVKYRKNLEKDVRQALGAPALRLEYDWTGCKARTFEQAVYDALKTFSGGTGKVIGGLHNSRVDVIIQGQEIECKFTDGALALAKIQ